MEKQRLDLRLKELYPTKSRHWIKERIVSGAVTVNGQVQHRPGRLVTPTDIILLHKPDVDFVSRAGHKLHHALNIFGVEVRDKRVLDLGVSTGGFTDCLLQAGAAHVWGVDVAAKEEVHPSIRNDPRVTVLERTNVQTWRWNQDPVDLVTVDLSFISVIKAIPAIKSALSESGDLLVLLKPQFELSAQYRNKAGVVKDTHARHQAIKRVVKLFEEHGFYLQAQAPSVIVGSAGNQEYVLWLRPLKKTV